MHGFKIPLPNKEMNADATSDRKGPKAHFMSSQGNLLYQNKYYTYAACVYACACQTERVRERKQMGEVYWLHIVYSLSTG